MAVEVLYEVDVADLKTADRGKRILRSVALFILQLALIFILVLILGIWAIFIFLLATYMFLPTPIIPTPSKYKITSRGVMVNERGVFSLRRGHRLRANEERRFVSILHRWRGEILRLYTPEPKRVVKVLDQLIPKP